MGRKLGYDVVKEKGGRVDERWQDANGKDVVAIEHENWGENIRRTMADVLKLLALESPLKVAVTYVPANKIDYFVRAWTMAILEQLKKRRNASEFLLVLGGDTIWSFPGDWFAVLFTPTYEARPLHYSDEFYSESRTKNKDAIVNRWVTEEASGLGRPFSPSKKTRNR